MTVTRLFNGRAMAEAMLEEIVRGPDIPPGALTVLHDPGAPGPAAYAHRIAEYARRIALPAHVMPYPADAQGLGTLAARLAGPVQLLSPAPAGLDLAELRDSLGPDRDPEGLHPLNCGRLFGGDTVLAPPTALAARHIARHLAGSLEGALIAIVGASPIVGRPLALLLLEDGATLRIAQAGTRDLAAETSAADIVISATGVPGLLGRDHLKAGAIVIDVGITRAGSRLVGDVDAPAVKGHAAWLTEVPDGIGPVTTACLLANAVTCLRRLNAAPTTRRSESA